MHSDDRLSAKEFICKMDNGDFDGAFSAELQNFSSALLCEILAILVERNDHGVGAAAKDTSQQT
jgi:predicted DNA-binding ribbon-helix-helix protein